MDFVVFSDDWGEHPSSCQHIFSHLVRDHKVLWVNTVGMRTPRLTLADFRKAARKLKRMFQGGTGAHVPTNPGATPVVIHPFMLPFPDSSLAMRWNARNGVRAIRRAMDEMGIEMPALVTTVPNACDIAGRLGAASVIYYCVDDFSQWPGLSSTAVREMENRLIDRCDLIIASSPVLHERLRTRKPAVLLPHGVDVDMFASTPNCEHVRLSGLPRPRAGFYGLLDSRLDVRLITSLADSMPDWSFVFAGPQEVPLKDMASRRNVHLVGPLNYRDLPSFTAGLDALLLPYRMDDFTQTLAPLKLREYVLSGLPVISSPLRGVDQFSGLVELARDPAEWEGMLRCAAGADVGERRERARSLLHDDDWSQKARILLDLAEASCR